MNVVEKAIKSMLELSDNRYVAFVLVLLSAYFIYRFGKSVGEFIYYVTH